MSSLFSRIIAIIVSFYAVTGISASAMTWIDSEEVTICPAEESGEVPPDFTSPDCRTAHAYNIDPQGKLIWVRANITLEKLTGTDGAPLSLYVSGKMASAFYLNGQYLGSNGQPGVDAVREKPGLMDTQFYPPPSLLRVGDNEIIFLASAHHGFLELSHPVHGILMGPAVNTADAILRYYWPSLLTLGIFILGSLYFGISAVIGQERRRALTFSLICGFAAAQLVAEVLRGLTAYAYPVHDLRLMAITLFSAGFGLTVTYHVLSTFGGKYLWRTMAGIAALCLTGIWVVPGFDMKAEAAIFIPLLASLTAAGYWTYQRRRRAFAYFLSLLVFVAAVRLFPSLFLDVIFFYIVAAFLLFLFAEQAYAMKTERMGREEEQARANRLELALSQAREREEASEVIVKSAGKIEHIPTDRISHCRGADGYCEIIISGGREVLHTVSLADMETSLPATFLRVHRSYLVNTGFVKSLTRDASGTGTLLLSDGSHVPVSRRTMPQVRQALG